MPTTTGAMDVSPTAFDTGGTVPQVPFAELDAVIRGRVRAEHEQVGGATDDDGRDLREQDGARR